MSKIIRFAGIALAASLALTATACSTPAPEDEGAGGGEANSITVSIGRNANDIALLYAIQQGYFAEEGLDVKTTVLQSGAQLIPLLLNGEIQVGLSNIPSVSAAVTQGIPVRFVSSAIFDPESGESFDGIIINPESGIETPKDLEGKSVAVPGISGSSALLTLASVAKDGGDPSLVKLVEMAQPDMIAAVQGGQIDAGHEVEPFVTMALDAGLEVLVYPASYAKPGQLFTGWVASQEFIDQNPEAAEGFATALARANAEIAEDVASGGTIARGILADHTEIAPELIEKIVLPTFSGEPLTPADIQGVIDSLIEFGLLEGEVVAADLIWNATS